MTLHITVYTFLLLHLAAAAFKWFRQDTDVDDELVRQHHERCAMLALIALAVLR